MKARYKLHVISTWPLFCRDPDTQGVYSVSMFRGDKFNFKKQIKKTQLTFDRRDVYQIADHWDEWMNEGLGE